MEYLYATSIYQESIRNVYEKMADLSDLNHKKILITGASGFIGSCLLDFLFWGIEKKGLICDVFAAVRNPEKIASRFAGRKKLEHLHILKYDMSQRIEWGYAFDYIIHAAGSGDPSGFMQNPSSTICDTLGAVEQLIEYGEKWKVKRLLFISSGEVYGKSDIGNWEFTEDFCGGIDSTLVRSCYPLAKKTAENLCISSLYNKDGSNKEKMDIVIARPCHIYGPVVDAKDRRAASVFVREAAIGNDIFLKSSGSQFRSWCYVTDCISGLLTILLKGKNGEIYNIASSGSRASIYEFAEITAKLAECEIKIENAKEEEEKIFNPMQYAVLSSGKLEGLGWKSCYDLISGLTVSLEITRKCCSYQPLISVVVPIYNVEHWINRCLCSITNQSYRNLEIILINDGSTDMSGEICQEWQKRDERIIYIQKKNGGLGDTRNLGISMAKGDYIQFVDSDDWLDENCLERLVEASEGGDADVVIFDYFLVTEEQGAVKIKEAPRFLKIGKSHVTLKEHPEILSRCGGTVWNKLQKTKLVKMAGLHQPSHAFEDIGYVYELLTLSERIVHVPQCLYYYWINREDSITNKEDHADEAKLALLEMRRSIEQSGHYECYRLQLEKYSASYLQIPIIRLKQRGYKSEIDQLKEFYYKLYPESLKIEQMKFLLLGSENVFKVYERMSSFPGDMANYSKIHFFESLPNDPQAYLLFDLWRESCLLSGGLGWEEKCIQIAMELEQRWALGRGVFYLESLYPLGTGGRSLEEFYKDIDARKKVNMVLKKMGKRLKELLPKMEVLAAPVEDDLFSRLGSGLLLNEYWHYDKADELRRILQLGLVDIESGGVGDV